MALSKSTRILILLGIDSVFFLIELIIGYAVHSLALVADSFHMLNDVLSLCVGLWAVKVANQKSSSKTYTYGWQRAETLGALVNGVFLVALCLSIFLEAIQRFVEPQTVTNPRLILIVGCFGLLSNILGLLLFHDHNHSHGGGSHHEHGRNTLASAEEGHSAVISAPEEARYEARVADESGNLAEVLPQSAVAGWNQSKLSPDKGHQQEDSNGSSKRSRVFSQSDEDRSTLTANPSGSVTPLSPRRSAASGTRRNQRRHGSGSRHRFSSVDELHVHPASFRNEIIAASRLNAIQSGAASDSGGDSAVEDDEAPMQESVDVTEQSPLLRRRAHTDGADSTDDTNRNYNSAQPQANGHAHNLAKQDSDALHFGHNHAPNPDDKAGGKSKGHSHGDLNMRGVFLHVMGDALGNVGVIASALFIWLTKFSWRFYADPLISLIITVIILCSAIPLCKAASRILLQAVPSHISVDHITEDIESLPGIISCHHLHVWQLSDVKFVASLHVQVECDFKGQGSAEYMELARAIRRCLHEYGIHSSTIQPEFCQPASNNKTRKSANDKATATSATAAAGEAGKCLLECSDDCAPEQRCCSDGPAAVITGNSTGGHDGHAH